MTDSSAKRIVDSIDAYIEGRGDAMGVNSVVVAGKQITQYSFDELLKLRSYYARLIELPTEHNSAGVVF